MARDLGSGTAYVEIAVSLTPTNPLTYACRYINGNAAQNDGAVVGIFDSTNIGNRSFVSTFNGGAGANVRLLTQSAATSFGYAGNAENAANWNSVVVRLDTPASTDRHRMCLNGDLANEYSATVANIHPSTANRFTCGYLRDSSPSNAGDVISAEMVCWDAALTDAEVTAFANGMSPLLIRPGSLQAYAPIWGIGSGESDYSPNRGAVTVSGTTVRADHAPTQLFGQSFLRFAGTSESVDAGGATIAVPSANTVTLQAGTPSISAAAGATVISPVATVSFGAQTPRAKGGASVRPAAASVLLSNGVPTITTGATYQPNGVEFDGTNDYLTRGADLTGNADSKLVTGSFWVNTSSATEQWLYTAHRSFQEFRVIVTSAGAVQIVGKVDGGLTTILSVRSSTGYADGAWHHCVFSFDMASASNRHLYIDDTSDLATVTVYTDNTIEFTTTDHFVGANNSAGNKLNGCLAQFWLAPGVYIDLSVASNRRKFVGSGAASSVDLGSDGSTPTGTAPLVFFDGATDSWHTNKGSGGGFTENGALTDCATDPPSAAAGTAVGVPAATISVLPATPSIVAKGPATVSILKADITINAQTPAIDAFERATVAATPVSIVLANGTPTITATQFATVAAVNSQILFNPQVPAIDAAPFLTVNVPNETILFNVQDVFIDATKEFKTAGVSVWEGVSFPEGVTDIRMTVGQAGVNDEAEEES